MPNRGTILIIDDDPSVRMLLRITLGKVGFSILEAENGAIGAELAAEREPDLVVTDWEMPVLGGRETIERLRSDVRTSKIPIVVLTSRTDPSYIVTALEAGAQDFIIKPLQSQTFVARLQQQLRWRRLLASNVAPGAGLDDHRVKERRAAPARRPVQEAMDRGDFRAALDLAVAGAEEAEANQKYLDAAGLYRGGASAAGRLGNPDLGNKLLRLAGKMYMLLAESAKSDGKVIEDAYTLAARMFMAAGNLKAARHAIEQTE